MGYDARIAGQVIARAAGESFLLDAGIPVLVAAPGVSATEYPEGAFVTFLLHDPPELVVSP